MGYAWKTVSRTPHTPEPPAHSPAHPSRLGAAELHVVASVMGGMAAQESIKLITRQFVPFSGSLIYNAVAQTISALEL